MLDPRELAAALRAIVGAEGVLARAAELLAYECDAYTLEKHPPDLVVLPRATAEVAAVVQLCAAHQLPIIPRGAGASLSGGVLAVAGGVMIGLSRMNRVLTVDARNRRALVEAGCVNLRVTDAARPQSQGPAPLLRDDPRTGAGTHRAAARWPGDQRRWAGRQERRRL